MTAPLVYVVTLNWNRKQDTLACLESLSRSDYPNLRLLVVDNGSTDGSPQAIAERFPEVEQVHNAENLGFARGTNAGLHHALQAGADFIFALNNDTLLAPDCLSALVTAARPDHGILAPLIYYAAEPEVIWAAGGPVSRWNLERSDPWADRMDPGRWPPRMQVDFVTGCGMMFPRSTLEQVGLFDERFPMYYEDADICLRVRRAGRPILVIPEARMWHKVATSSGGRDTPNERYWMARSSVRYFSKHARGVQIPIVALWRTASALRTTLRLARLGNREALAAYWRGLMDGFRDWRDERGMVGIIAS